MLRKTIITLLGAAMLPCLLAGCGDKDVTLTTPEPLATTGAQVQAAARATELYYVDKSGYVLPVTAQLPWQEGIGGAALSCLVEGNEPSDTMGLKGLSAPIPRGSDVQLDIQDGTATVMLSLSEDCADAAAEQDMAACIVNTLMEFESVDRVQLKTADGSTSLKHGTDISAPFEGNVLNIEPAGAPENINAKAELYFLNESGSFLVPVMRAVTVGATPTQIVSQLCEPQGGTTLTSALPDGCRVISVAITETGVATVDMSKEFLAVSGLPAVESAAYKALQKTVLKLPGVLEVKITVEGEAWEPSAQTMSQSAGINILE